MLKTATCFQLEELQIGLSEWSELSEWNECYVDRKKGIAVYLLGEE